MRAQPFAVGVALAFALVGPPAARGQIQYSYTIIARTGTGTPLFTSLFAPSINGTGTAAFGGTLQGVDQGIFTGNGGALTTIAQTGTGSQFARFSADLQPPFPPVTVIVPSINPTSNQTAFFAIRTAAAGAGNGVFVGSGGATTSIVTTSATVSGTGFGPGINPSGTVALVAGLASGVQRVFTGTGGATTTIVTTGTVFTNFSPQVMVNGSGTVSFVAGLTATAGGGAGVFTSQANATNLSTIAVTGAAVGPVFSNFLGSTAINGNGRVAFVAQLLDGRTGIFTGAPGQTPIPIALNGGVSPFASFGPSPFVSIDSAGSVAFAATLIDGRQGVFTGPDPVANRVIIAGQSLDNSTVTAVGFAPRAFNDRGDVGFAAQLADGRQVVVVATFPVPEPAGALAVAAAALGLTGAVRRWRNRGQ
jgi:hypothetical protein